MKMKLWLRLALLNLLAFIFASSLAAQNYTRGVGVYPGNPKEYNGATPELDAKHYRNLALHRPAYASSSYDFNLTPQLITDGIKETKIPRWLSTSTSEDGMLPRNRREHLVDDNPVSSVDIPGTGGWVQIEPRGGDAPLDVDRIDVTARVQTQGKEDQVWTCIISGSDDAQSWTELGRTVGHTAPLSGTSWWPVKAIHPSFLLASSVHMRFYRVQLDAPLVTKWQVGEVTLFYQNHRIELGGPYNFTSAWKSGGSGEEWVSVDLGAECTFDRVVLSWIQRAAEGAIQVSEDAKTWTTIQPLSSSSNQAAAEDLKLQQPARGRYVRVDMTKATSDDGYVLSEFEIFGTGGPLPQPQLAAAPPGDGRLTLARGSWQLQRDSLVSADGETISKTGFASKDWLPATVPGTVLSSYLDDGALPDPNYGNNQLMISDSFFWADFWYRDHFVLPHPAPGRHVWLNFDGINWKADVFFNGQKLGSIDGGFMRGKFDITKLLRDKNVLAVLIHKNATPGSVKEKTFAVSDWNGGALGADNPTYHASIGWDWIPTIRGRNIGIPNDVYITTTGAVVIENPFVSTTLPLPDVNTADVAIEVTLRNVTAQAVTGTLKGRFGAALFQARASIPANGATTVKLNPSTSPALRLKNPKLWWPVGYGDPALYDVKMSFMTAAGAASDKKSFRSGVRQFTYTDEGGPLKIFINGRRFIPRGGNWGFSESMLRYGSREYDAALRYHKEMNFNMIRNWVGQISDNAFYEACDKYGVVIWQDFWLANPYDGPDPDDNDLFLRNATDTVERIRNHPSIGLYCGRNEGDPPPPLEAGIEKLLADLDPGLRYFPGSSFGPVSGGGPYRAMPAKFYFEHRATTKLHSELGMPNIVSLDSLKQMMPEADQWPQGDDWGMHDFTSTGAQSGASYQSLIQKSYGPADNAADWDELAQFENYDGYRAMFEAQSQNRMGLLLWMSHPSWPSFVWQTYDYYFDPTAAYFGSKKASEPLHIQWNPLTDNVEVVNYSAGSRAGLTAAIEILNMDGSVQWQKTATVDSAEDSVNSPIKIEYPANLTPVHFLRLKLLQGQAIISENFYWRGLEEGNFQDLRKLPKVEVSAATNVQRQGTRWMLTTDLTNSSTQPALMVRLKAVREKSGDRILPAIYNDNYIALMPGEKRTIITDLDDADTRGETPRIDIDGFNVQGH